MSVFDFFRKIFVGSNESTPSGADSQFRNDFRHPIWDNDESDDSDNDFRHSGNTFRFNLFTDPIEMHRFFEQQMNEMLKNFNMLESFQDFDTFFGSGMNQFGHPELPPSGDFHHRPAIEEPCDSSENLRDQILKPGFRQPRAEKTDEVLDGKINANEVGEALERKNDSIQIWTPNSSNRTIIPKGDSQFSPNRGIFSFSGKSMSTRIVTRPDGTVEREEVVKNSDGSERKTVTRTLGDHEYTITTFRDASGAEQTTENFKNIDREKLEDFNRGWSKHDNNSKWRDWLKDWKPIF